MNWFNNFLDKIVGKKNKEAEQRDNEQISSEERLVDENYLFELEEKLLRADCGWEFTEYVVETLRKQNNNKNFTIYEAKHELKKIFEQALMSSEMHDNENNKQNLFKIILIIGVNGSGKTTSIGKLAYKLKEQSQTVLIVPCDTFRAAANEQLSKWAERAGAEIFRSKTNSIKADSILFEAMNEAQRNNIQTLIVDTAGRLQNKIGLMDELSKLAKVIDKHAPSHCIIERLLVIDATTGQNGYNQAVLFNEATKVTGIILSKFDGTAKGGILFAIGHNLKIPIKYIGVGEQINQLQEFRLEDFLNKAEI